STIIEHLANQNYDRYHACCRSSAPRRRSQVVGHVRGHQSAVASRQSPVASRRSAVGDRRSAVSGQRSITGYWLLWLLAVWQARAGLVSLPHALDDLRPTPILRSAETDGHL